jgi:hypothetical protein
MQPAPNNGPGLNPPACNYIVKGFRFNTPTKGAVRPLDRKGKENTGLSKAFERPKLEVHHIVQGLVAVILVRVP